MDALQLQPLSNADHLRCGLELRPLRSRLCITFASVGSLGASSESRNQLSSASTSLIHKLPRRPADQPPPWRDMALSKAQRQAAWFTAHRPERRLPQLRPDGSKVVAGELMVRVESISGPLSDPALTVTGTNPNPHPSPNPCPDFLP